jgi:hypothetical protein
VVSQYFASIMDIRVVSHMFPSPANQVSGIFVKKQAEALTRRGHEVTVISPVPYVPRAVANVLNRTSSRDIPTTDSYGDVVVHYPRYWSLPRAETLPLNAYSFRRTLRRHRDLFSSADVINAHVALPDGFGALPIAESLDVPLVTTVHGADLQHSVHRRIAKRQLKTVFSNSEQVVVNSSKLKQLYSSHFGDTTDVKVIHNGIDVENIHKTEPAPRTGSGLQIISVGSLVPEKGHKYTLRALSEVDFEYELLLIGDGPQRGALEELASELGIATEVQFMGQVEHDTVISNLKASDIFVLPSYEEAFGIAYLEAMACGLPAIGCRGEGPADYISDNKTGILVSPRSVDELMRAIVDLATDSARRTQIAKRARQVALYGFSWDRNAKSLELILERSLSEY